MLGAAVISGPEQFSARPRRTEIYHSSGIPRRDMPIRQRYFGGNGLEQDLSADGSSAAQPPGGGAESINVGVTVRINNSFAARPTNGDRKNAVQ